MQHNKPSKVYIGIDLGTTNSLAAWGGIDSRTKRLNPQIIKISRKVDADRFSDGILLPSIQYFPKHGTPFVGDCAEKMLGKDPNRVARSTKCRMDKGSVDLGLEAPCTPIGVAKSILKHLKFEADLMFKFLPSFPEVVITVPASFPKKMRDATIEAAVEAGFGITDQSLLEEPTAALHYFCNQKLPAEDIEFDKSKILVFDLGGGTLDVSLHEVTKIGNSLTITDIAKSPYKRFGGDQFDKKVGDVLLSKYVKHRNPAKTSDEKDRLKKQFQFYAKKAKENLADQINYIPSTANPLYSISEPPSLPTVGVLPPFHCDLRWDEYKYIIEPFLATHLSLKSPYYSWRVDNIIDPILQVLDEGGPGCSERPKVDIVLLNGGMTKLPVIEQRLKELFGEGVIVYNDSDNADKAVALGAVYHQASL